MTENARPAPADAVTAMVDHVLTLAATWPNWDGTLARVDDRVYTPHKAVRRVADHLIDHLAELEARLAGEQPQPDHWHASALTGEADLAPFTAQDLDEARSRLTRLARIWANRLDSVTDDQLVRPPGEGWSFCEPCTSRDRRTTPTGWATFHDPAHSGRR